MESTEGETMNLQSEAVDALLDAVQGLNGCGLLVVDKKIKNLLKCIAYYPELRELVEECGKSTSYKYLREKSIRQIQGRPYFTMPTGDAEVIIFVLNLLLEFDNGTQDLLAFTKKYFPAEDEQTSYRIFYENVIEVFADKISRVMIEGLTPSGDTSDRDRDIDYVNDGIRQQLSYLLEKLVEELDATNKISKKVRADYFRMMEGFQIALNSRDIELIKGMWTAIRRCLKYDDLFEKLVLKVDDVLKLYMVI